MGNVVRRVILVLVLLIGGEAVAQACVNATLHDSTSVAKLQAAEAALDEGDVLTARELTLDARGSFALMPGNAANFNERADRIHALSYVRDPEATDAELAAAVEQLRRLTTDRDMIAPDIAADYGEALERTGRRNDAYEVLEPFIKKDLIGSAYALSAFSRAAKERGDVTNAELAMKRCESVAVTLAACRGEYPPRPFLRGSPRQFWFLACLFFVLFTVRVARRTSRPWSQFHPWRFAPMVLAIGIAAFVAANHQHGTMAATLVLPILILGYVQRTQWLGALRAGRLGLTVRPATADDVAPRTLRFFGGPRVPEIVEHAIDPSYRESARAPALFRLERSQVRLKVVFLLIAVAGLFAGCGMVFLATARG